MTLIEGLILFGFGVPIVLLSCAFVLCAGYMQMKEDEKHPVA